LTKGIDKVKDPKKF